MDVFTNIALEFWMTLREMSPYLLFGFLIAGILSVFVTTGFVVRHLGHGGFSSILKASLFGVPLPLCSCGVIPVAASLRRRGASRSATIAFLLSTPQTGVDSIMVTMSLLGPVAAVFRPLAALITGFIGGTAVAVLDPDKGDGSDETASVSEDAHSGSKLAAALRYGFVTLPREISKAMFVGLLIAGVLGALIPHGSLADYGSGPLAMILVMAIAVPIYVCATASVPIAAAMIAKGVSPGVALVFLIAGPATNAAAITTIWRVMGRKTTVIYLATVAVCSLCAGLILDHLLNISSLAGAHHAHSMMPGYLLNVSAAVLLVVLGAGLIRRSSGPCCGCDMPEGGTKTVIGIKGMSCGSCAEAVRAALAEEDGITSAAVDLGKKQAVVTGDDYSVDSLRSAVENLGYTVTDITPEEETK